MVQPFIVGIRFSKLGKIYHFDGSSFSDLRLGDHVIVETSRGWQLGEVAQIASNSASSPGGGLKPVDRKATPRDLLMRKMWQQKETEVVEATAKRIKELNLYGIKIVGSEFSFDGSRLTIFFSSESEEKAELRSLRPDIQKMYAQSQVELRQLGPRDVAKMLCGMGACGLETRCCSRFLVEFSSISIRMAKEQDISLTPSEITGMCGRLRCCLVYEYDQYVEARKLLPKRNKRVMTPVGEGRVIDVAPMREMVIVELPEGGHREFKNSEIQVMEDSATLPPTPTDQGQQPQQPSQPSQPNQSTKSNPNRPHSRGDKRKR